MKLLILGALLFLAPAAFATAGDLVFRQSSAGDLDVVDSLKNFADFLTRLFPGGRSSSGKLVLVLGRDPDTFASSDEVRVVLDPAALRRGDLDELAKAGKAILLHRKKCLDATPFPRWIGAAFRHKTRAAGESEIFLSNHRIFPGVEAMLRHGPLPERQQILSALPFADSSAENLWFDEYSRVNAVLLQRSGFRGSVEEVETALNKICSGPEGQKIFRTAIWNRWNPMPFSEYEKLLSELLQIQASVVENGKVSGKTETFPAAKLTEKCASHPELAQICSSFSEKVLRAVAGFPMPLRSGLRRLSAAAAAAGRNPEQLYRFDLALKEIDTQLKKLKAQEEFLDQCSGTPDRVIKVWHSAIEENSRSGTLLTPEGARFLQESEKYYIR